MKFILDIDIDNDAFMPRRRPEIARILRELAKNSAFLIGHSYPIRDINGNLVGYAAVTKAEEVKRS